MRTSTALVSVCLLALETRGHEWVRVPIGKGQPAVTRVEGH